MKTEGGPSAAEKASPNGHKPNLKERAVRQLREFLAMFIYLWVLLTLFVINQSAVLAREHHNYQAHFFAFANALILPTVPSGGAASADDRHRHLPYRISLHSPAD